MRLTVSQKKPGCADGRYQLRAKGCVAASLHWADASGALPGWQSFAYIPIEPAGEGVFRFSGGRAIPENATHVLARAVSADFSSAQEALVPIPNPVKEAPEVPRQRLLVLGDLHLANKPWQVRRALSRGKNCDGVLLTGDLTNDGTEEQLTLLWKCITEVLPQTPVFAVAGNHDYPAEIPSGEEGNGFDYPAFQKRLLDRARQLGIDVVEDASGAYAAMLGQTQIIGLNAVTPERRFRFPGDAQLKWLLLHLVEPRAKRNILLCHAPLASHRPNKSDREPAYLGSNAVLQRIVDVERTEVIFLSGHTHISMNAMDGCVEMADRGHLYINAGSIRPTTLKKDEYIQPAEWVEGNGVELLLGEERIGVTAFSVKTGQRFPRGHYRFGPEDREKEFRHLPTGY